MISSKNRTFLFEITFAPVSVSSKSSDFVMGILVIATEWPGKSAISQHLVSNFVKNNYTLENFPTFTTKFRFENSKCRNYGSVLPRIFTWESGGWGSRREPRIVE